LTERKRLLARKKRTWREDNLMEGGDRATSDRGAKGDSQRHSRKRNVNGVEMDTLSKTKRRDILR